MPDTLQGKVNKGESALAAAERYLKELPNHEKTYTAYYGGIKEDGNINYFNWACHAQMNNLRQSKVIFSRFKRNEIKDVYTRYVTEAEAKLYNQWLTSKQSPWLSVLEAGMSMKGDMFKRSFWQEHGFVFDQLDKVPSNFLQSFLIATRVPKQFPNFCKMWYYLVHDQKVHPTMAFLMITGINPIHSDKGEISGKDYWMFLRMSRGDWAIGMDLICDAYIERFKAGTPVFDRLNPAYSKSSAYHAPNGINVLWLNDKERADVNNRWFKHLTDTYSKRGEKINPYSFTHEKQTVFTKEQIAEIAHEEQKRLGFEDE